MIYTVTLNPALDKTVEIPSLAVDSVNRVLAMRTDPGGKGINVSKVIDRLGGNSLAVGILGGTTGQWIRAALAQMGLNTYFLSAAGETRTNLKIIDPVNHTNTDINEPGFAVTADILEGLLAEVTARLRKGDIVVLSGSLPKGAPGDTYRIWGNACRKKGAKVFLDAAGELLAEGLKASPYLVKPNHHELSGLMGRELTKPEELAEAARSLIKRYSVEKAVVSMGGAGGLYVTADAAIYAEGLKVPVRSTVGAGDSVVAALARAEEQGLSLEDTVRLSMAAGAANVMESGTQAAEYGVIETLIPKAVFHYLQP